MKRQICKCTHMPPLYRRPSLSNICATILFEHTHPHPHTHTRTISRQPHRDTQPSSTH